MLSRPPSLHLLFELPEDKTEDLLCLFQQSGGGFHSDVTNTGHPEIPSRSLDDGAVDNSFPLHLGEVNCFFQEWER